ncbi:hypothetical protein [Jiulongibacter sediminis]|uniref:hypothetical protein n=1 Tax=Jiulongibacter sediminis TaxID=1605367 RepID=UPI0006DCF798|nr:hypothetical protein [Jiulongibacter sediminis]
MENLKCLFTNFPLDIFWALLLPLFLLWWYMNRLVNRYKSHASELQDRINFLEGELEACRKNKVSRAATADMDGLKAKISKLEADLDACNKAKLAAAATGAVSGTAVAGVASLASDKPKKKDDLKVVEGIGPKIEGLCHDAGIYTFADLANASAETIKGILSNAGPRFQMHDPTTWPKQAELARDGKWDELKAWQDELDKGRQ